MNLATLMLSAALCIGVTNVGQAQKQTPEQPNILFIMVDDLGKDWIGCYGADDVSTPNIDALASNGMKFTHAYAMPQCTPTRVTLLTGQYPWRTGWVNHWDVPRWGVGYFDWEHYATFARVVQTAGYKTCAAGKWQINDFRLEPQAMRKHGFDDWCLWTGYETGNPPSGKRYWDPYIHTPSGSKAYAEQFGPDIYADYLIDFMKRNRDQPMCLYYPMTLTHGPLVSPPGAAQGLKGRDQFRAMVEYTDLLVGKLVSALDELDLRERTIIIFTTDNGSPGGLLGTIDGKRPAGGKASKFEGGVCMPFIVNWPQHVPAGTTTDALTDFTDMLPTFADLARASVPDDWKLDGVSLAPVMLGKAKDSKRKWIMALGHGPAKLTATGIAGKSPFVSRVIRDRRWKAWVNEQRKIDQLFDLQTDPLEQTNLIDQLSVLDSEARAAFDKFQAVIDHQPAQDARPRYRTRDPNPWDRQVNKAKPIGR